MSTQRFVSPSALYLYRLLYLDPIYLCSLLSSTSEATVRGAEEKAAVQDVQLRALDLETVEYFV